MLRGVALYSHLRATDTLLVAERRQGPTRGQLQEEAAEMAIFNVYAPLHTSFDDGTPSSQCRVRVQYFQDQDVRVGVECSSMFREDGMTVWNEVDGGLWSDLDRAGINQLIRVLREARDKAYGRDE
jgi:hypothetical protein